MIFDPMYFLFIAPAFLLSIYASWKTKSAFNKYSKQRNSRNISGADAAREMLRQAGIGDVNVTRTSGFLSDHYNPTNKTLALSDQVYSQPSVAAVGVACHEAGHAIQHAEGYKPMWIRSALVPTANIGSSLGYIVMLVGLFISPNLVLLGAALFSMVLLFQVVTLPVEFDASSRAKKLAYDYGIVSQQDRQGVSKVLNAAAMTYVAAAISTLMTLLYFLFRAGLLGGRD